MTEYCAVIGLALNNAVQQTAVKEVTRPLPPLVEHSRVGLCKTRVEGGPTSHESSGFGPRWTRTIYSCSL